MTPGLKSIYEKAKNKLSPSTYCSAFPLPGPTQLHTVPFSSVPGAGFAAKLRSEASTLRPSAFKSSSFRKGVCHTTPSRGDSPQSSHLVRDRDE